MSSPNQDKRAFREGFYKGVAAANIDLVGRAIREKWHKQCGHGAENRAITDAIDAAPEEQNPCKCKKRDVLHYTVEQCVRCGKEYDL